MFEKVLELVGLQKATPEVKNKFVSTLNGYGFDFMKGGLQGCGKVIIDLNTMYKISRTNKMAGAYIDKIANMIGRYGIDLYDDKDQKLDLTIPKNMELSKKVKEFFRCGYADNKTFSLFSALFFTHIFSSGECTFTANMLNDIFQAPKDGRVKILDTRGIQKSIDEFGNINYYSYTVGGQKEVFAPGQVVNYIAFPDVDRPAYGLSKFNKIYMEAITNFEANNNQMYFFKNKSVPNVMVMLDSEKMEGKEQVEAFKEMWDRKFGGTSNTSKPLLSDIVKDVKVLDMSNVDMDLLNLRKENDKDFATIFLLDTRLIGLSKDTGSYGEIESSTMRQGNDQIDSYGSMLSEAMNIAYRKFIDDKFPYRIATRNAYFTDDMKEKEMGMKEVASGVRTPNEYIVEFGNGTPSDQEGMDQYKSSAVAKTQNVPNQNNAG